MKTINFKMAMDNGTKVNAVGVPYTTKNGINVAIHKKGNFWYATELSTGKAIATKDFHGVRTIKEAKAGVENLSSTVAKVLKSEQAKKPAQAKASKTVKKPAAQCSQKSKSKTGACVQSQKAASTAAKSKTTFSVRTGRDTKTFATKKEAQEAARQSRTRNVSVTPGTRKPTHRIVSFTAKT